MNVQTLRSSLASTLQSVLGTYTLSNGYTTPAISVRPAGERIQVDWRVTGLECVIQRDAIPIPVRQYRNQVAFNTWVVDLIAWSETTDMQQVTALLLTAWPGSSFTELSVKTDTGPVAARRVVLREGQALAS